MEDLGPPGSYLTLSRGLEVYSSDGRGIGRVEEVVAEPGADVFEGFVIEAGVLGGHRFVDATLVDEIYERGVVLTIDAAAAGELPRPSSRPGGR